MNRCQQITYIKAARTAFEAREVDVISDDAPSFDDWRHNEVAYALQLTAGKKFSEFDQLDLTKCLVHFWALSSGELLPPNEIWRRAFDRHIKGGLSKLRELWDVVPARLRDHVMSRRFKITFWEEIATLDARTLKQVRWTLMRLARKG